ncbi:dephospho-CoA kinase [Pullulanibacillus camelliae]|uniref:Dephospho-CoA kinase n=1 Tax=Pullulanibacillus camelliae TaxID=1707096 RepID=A0A8J2YKW1_9BACL|nr:dephospho-CoA kinase [Pullulanibacillus camelliae]GGE51937.1 dephospho-CoA kinase [Pullulanibacillus camelliae]
MRIGLTGGIASGKSTVANMLRERAIPVVDADVAARKVVEPGQKAYEQIVAYFGEEILLEDQTLNRKKLGQRIFANEADRLKLNRMVHPEVRRYMLERVAAYEQEQAPAIVLDIPLLFESKLNDWVDKTLVVYVPYALQLERLMARDDLTQSEAEQRIKTQLSLEKKKQWADRFIDNSRTREETEQQLDAILQSWLS